MSQHPLRKGKRKKVPGRAVAAPLVNPAGPGEASLDELVRNGYYLRFI